MALAHATDAPWRRPPVAPRAIFVLRPNDLGDVLVTTPLLAALRSRYPDARLVIGVGSWSQTLLANNPNVSDIAVVPAPWHNKYVADQSARAQSRFILRDPALKRLRREHFDIGIDVLGSGMGSLLLRRIGARYRMGVRGYGGGQTGVHVAVSYNPLEPVARSALRFAELLGATSLPDIRPQIFLTTDERAAGERQWPTRRSNARRWVVAPGAGLPDKTWSPEAYAALANRLANRNDVDWLIVGTASDQRFADAMQPQLPGMTTRIGQLSLRETMAAIAASDGVVSSPSVMMHVAAGLEKPSVILLGDLFESATVHAAQWGYPGRWINLGREPGAPMPTIDDAVDAIDRILANTRRN